MFRTALVAVDLSPAEKPLLGCLPDLRGWGVGSVVLAHVIQVGYIEGAGFGHEDEYRAWLEKRAAPLRQAGFDVAVSVSVSGVSADALLGVAKQHKADLVVVGSRSHNVLYDLFVGGVAKDIIRKSEIPVLIEALEPMEAGDAETCRAVSDRSLDRILLATDWSDQSRSAEDAALYLASRAKEIDCLTVLPKEVADGAEAERTTVESKLRALAQRIEANGGRAGTRIERGDPTEVIAQVGQDGYSMIIVGKHGQNWIEGKVIGSTSAKVCEIARRPVMMVPLRKA